MSIFKKKYKVPFNKRVYYEKYGIMHTAVKR